MSFAVQGKHVWIVGDSHMEALGPRLVRGIQAQGGDPGYVAHRGWSERKYMSDAEGRAALAHGARADLVIVALGGNNQTMDAAAYKANIQRVLGQIGLPASKVVWVGPSAVNASRDPETARRHAATRELQRAILPTLGVRWVDSWPVTQTGQGADGVHFTRDGYDAWANYLLKESSSSAGIFIMLGLAAMVGVVFVKTLRGVRR